MTTTQRENLGAERNHLKFRSDCSFGEKVYPHGLVPNLGGSTEIRGCQGIYVYSVLALIQASWQRSFTAAPLLRTPLFPDGCLWGHIQMSADERYVAP